MTRAAARKAVILLTHLVTPMVRNRYATLRATLHPQFDVVLLLTAAGPDVAGIEDCVVLDEAEIFRPEYGRKSASRSILPGNTELPLLAFWRRRPDYDSLWLLEYDVWLPCGGETLREIDQASDADLIVAHPILTAERSRNWHWWTTFDPPAAVRERLAEGGTAYSLFMISRFGASMFPALDAAYRGGWSGHHEATVTSIALDRAFRIEDLNQIGLRTLGRRVVRNETFHVHHCVPMDASTIYHPVKDADTEQALRAVLFGADAQPVETENQEIPAQDRFPILPALAGAELEFFGERLTQARCYGEFGVGGSTVLAAMAPLHRVIAVESDPAWLRRVGSHAAVRALVEDGIVTLLQGDIGKVVDWGYPVAPPPTGAAYFDAPWPRWRELGEIPDMVFLDGRYRVACALAALRFAREVGGASVMKIVMNDYTPQRRFYRAMERFMTLAEQCGGLAVFVDSGTASDEELSRLMAAHAADAR